MPLDPAPVVAAGRNPERAMTDRADLLASIRAGEDSKLELKEVVFSVGPAASGGERCRASSGMADGFVSLAHTHGGIAGLAVRVPGRALVGVETVNRERVERLVNGVAAADCESPIDRCWDCVLLPGEGGTERLCSLLSVPCLLHEIHRTTEGRYLQCTGRHRLPLSTEYPSRIRSGHAP